MITYLRAKTPWLEESLTIVLSRLSYITGLKHNGNESRQYLILNYYTNYIITQNVKHWTNNKHQIFLFLAWTIFFWSKKLRPWSTGRSYLAEVLPIWCKTLSNQSINQSINQSDLVITTVSNDVTILLSWNSIAVEALICWWGIYNSLIKFKSNMFKQIRP